MCINKDMIILDIVEKYPETEDVFHMYDEAAGTCILCSNLFDSLENALNKYGLDLDKVMHQLNTVIDKNKY
ncbi:disulfide oxidoreductase [Caloramator sp. mosi_1]|uniref:disulfide oxidoreductase n=1 Tax=Caloramator sp. mosi_1 TaxID=3023090 RepID=UPI00235F2FE6|nr:disulfide oxidoreductase [Caloramator sp. mosi_1]WDC83438.1 disulfide oxidoreductase [Caloramator sp. mosi_1]